ncbi:MAG: glycosyltransferase family 39 protein [Deltaproteobacteria bacterium]|nr:glycosyltransferase family 39 protein [Deltaproteobacteria bacterium]
MSAWRRRKGFTVALVFCAAALFGLASEPDLPVTDDARFYVPAARAYGLWATEALTGLFTLDLQPFARPRLDAAFSQNHEHPPVAKYVMAAGWLLLHHLTGLLDDTAACRVFVVFLWAWMIALVFALVDEVRGTAAAAFAALGLALLPRVLFDGHAETLDLPVAAFMTFALATTWRHLERPTLKNGGVAILAFALALGTKHNAPFFLAAAVLYWLLVDRPRLDRLRVRLPPVPLALSGMVVAAPLVVWIMWPWLWFDTLPRLSAYLQYHLHHYGIFFYYGGKLYGDDVAPWYAPLHLTLLTVPLPFLLVAALGLLLVGQAMLPRRERWKRLTADAVSWRDDAGARLGLFALLQLVVQLGAVSWPTVPKYGGVKLFLPVFPFLAILAGLGCARLERELAGATLTARVRMGLRAVTWTLLLLPSAVGVLGYRGLWLSYYNEVALGVRGAAGSGHERQYYDLAYPALAADLARLLPDGGKVAVLPNPKEYGPHLARWQDQGRVSARLRLAAPEAADFLVLTHEQRWREYPLLMARYRGHKTAARLSVAGVPLYTVFDLR